MSIIHQRLVSFFQQFPHCPIVVAYSGGVDSQVLLHALATLTQQNKLQHPLSVCHVNHGLSAHANQWQEFAKNQCQRLKLPFKAFSVDVNKRPRQSLEALAREKRYQVLTEYSEPNALIATGHHQDDQIETFFLALKRGSGLKGLSAMADNSQLGEDQQRLVRPLLSCSRQDILIYAKQHGLSWIEDESNSDTQFDRNFLRQNILPLLVERWPSINQTIERSIGHCHESQLLLDELAHQDFTQCSVESSVLSVTSLVALSDARFNHVIRYLLTQHQELMPSFDQLKELRKQLTADSDKTPQVKVGDMWLRKYRDNLYLTPSYQPVDNWRQNVVFNSLVDQDLDVELPDNLGLLRFSYNTVIDDDLNVQSIAIPTLDTKDQIEICFSHSNPKCLPDYRQHHRSLKKVLQERDIPPWQRKRTPLLFLNDQLVAAVGQFVCKPFVPQHGQRKINVCWLGQPKSG